MDRKVLRKTYKYNKNGPEKKHRKAAFVKHSTSNNPDQNKSSSKLKTFGLFQQRSRAQNHNNTNALFINEARTGLPTLMIPEEEDDPNFRL